MTTLPPVDEDHARDFVFEYSDAKRMAPYRANVLLEKALQDKQPAPPDEDVSVWVCLERDPTGEGGG